MTSRDEFKGLGDEISNLSNIYPDDLVRVNELIKRYDDLSKSIRSTDEYAFAEAVSVMDAEINRFYDGCPQYSHALIERKKR